MMSISKLLKEASEHKNNWDGKGKERVVSYYRWLQQFREGKWYWDATYPPPDIELGSRQWKKIYGCKSVEAEIKKRDDRMRKIIQSGYF